MLPRPDGSVLYYGAWYLLLYAPLFSVTSVVFKSQRKKAQTTKAATREPLFGLPLAPPPAKSAELRATAQHFSKSLLSKQLSQSIERPEQLLATRTADSWVKAGERRALALFHEAAARVPAYKDFLRKQRIKPELIKTIEDFQKLPLIDKDNYLREYPLDALSWDGLMSVNHMVSVSSGSSGVPMYWPRGSLLEMESTWMHELILKRFKAHQTPTLVVDLFSMGMYIAGPITLNSVLRVAQKGYPLTVITPGLDMNDTMSALINVMDQFKQIVFAGYPPFVKDTIDEGQHRGINWRKWRVRYILAGEGFTEGWRNYMGEVVRQKKTILADSVNLYGTADAAVVAHETPTSIAIRRRALASDTLYHQLFTEGDNGRLPSFVQYYPTLKYFEAVANELVFTATAGIPLIRYNIHDVGSVVSFDDAVSAVQSTTEELAQELQSTERGLAITQLPFVYLYGKSDLTVTLYGLNVYPENIKLALEQRSIRNSVSGRFAMSTEYREDSNDQYLLVHIELARGILPSERLELEVTNELIATLRTVNFEYGKLYASIGDERSRPQVRLHAYQESSYFNREGKQRWKV